MKISLSTDSVTGAKADLIAIGVRARKVGKDEHVQRLDKAMGGALLQQAKDEDFQGDLGEVLKVPSKGRVGASWIVLVGLGSGDVTERDALKVAVHGASAARKQRVMAVVLPVAGALGVRSAAEGAVTGAYRYAPYFTGSRKPKGGIKGTVILVEDDKDEASLAAAREGKAVGEATNLARDLVNAPPNDLTPTALADSAQSACEPLGVQCTVWGKQEIEDAGMTLFLAVNRGSNQEPRFVHMVHAPEGATKKVAFIGKGLTFDAGGLCLKPAKAMADMKCDMAGAATTVGIMLAVAKLKLPIEVHALIGATENMLGGDAYRPGDVFKSLDGKTVEVINTDAEGRMVLADVLSFAREIKPDYMIDHATLTGACMVALGKWRAGLFSNSDELASAYGAAAERVGEAYWQMPLDEELRDVLKSDIADLKHVGDSHGGAITAALFLSEFVGRTKWAHCDIAGPAFLEGAHGTLPKGGTGFGVATGVEFLRKLCEPPAE